MSKSEEMNPLDELRNYLGDPAFEQAEWSGRSTDWMIQWMVEFSNKTGFEFGVSLTVGGNLVSGRLIPHKKYFELLAAELSGGFESISSNVAEEIKNTIASFSPVEAEGEEPPPQYIHLANARIFADSKGPIYMAGNLWRGKVRAVDGFSFGRLDSIKASD